MSVAERVRNFIKNKPYIQESLEKGIVNLSSLARKIQEELGIEKFEAVKAALRRLSEELQKTKHKREERVLQILKKSMISMHDGNSVVIAEEPIQVKEKIRVNLQNNFVYLLEKNQLPKTDEKILRKTENCTTIIIHSPKEIETTPGVVAYLTSLLAEQNINVIEFISCWTDTILVIDRKDTLRAYEILSEVVGIS